MKKIKILLILSLFSFIAKSQTISPSQNNEFCPGVEYNFTISTIQKINNIYSEGNCIITQMPILPVLENSVFSIKVKFADLNQKQTINLLYSNNTILPIDFIKIKSIFYSSPCAIIQPNVSVLNAPRCQIVNFPINFSNIPWYTAFQNPSLCFGSITNYEYQLPSGWSIGSNVSNGNNWIPGNNSVTITSDLSNGVNGFVYIRPLNDCSNVLINGESQKISIPVSRPAPTLSITSSSNGVQLCANQTKNYSINGMPSGATVQWTLAYPYGATNTNLAQFTSSTNTQTVNVQAAATGSGYLYVRATVSHCSFVYTVDQFLQIGIPQSIIGRATYINNGIYQSLNSTINFTNNTDCWIQLPYPVAVPYTWVKNQSSNNVTFTVASTQYKEAANVKFNRPVSSGASINLSVNSSSNCGNITDRFTIMYNGPTLLSVSPNPASTEITVETIPPTTSSDLSLKAAHLGKEDKVIYDNIVYPKMRLIKLTDKSGKQIDYYDYSKLGGKKKVTLDITKLLPGIYTLSIFNGNQWSSENFIKK